MDISILEDNIENLSDPKYISIIELIIDAVNAYPEYGLTDTVDYFNEINKILSTNNIDPNIIRSYVLHADHFKDEKAVWILDSLGSLAEAFSLMQIYGIRFDEVLQKMESLQ